MNNIYKLASLFYKYAVETPEWMPEDIRLNMDSIDYIEKDPRLKSFKAELPKETSAMINKMALVAFLDGIFGELAIQRSIAVKSYEVLSKGLPFPIEVKTQYIEDFKVLTDKIIKFMASLTEENLNANKIVIDKNTFKISKYYNLLFKKLQDLFARFYKYFSDKQVAKDVAKTIMPITGKLPAPGLVDEFYYNIMGLNEKIKIIKSFDNIEGKKDWDIRVTNKKHYVVFTTDYTDILGMSSRSNWTSCQDIRPEKPHKDPFLYQQLVGSAFEPSVGLIYITDGVEKKYGENMIARSTVWIITKKESGEELLSLQRIYPQNNEDISNIFKEELKKHTGFDVINIDIDEKKPSDYYADFTMEYLKPYDDIGIANKSSLDSKEKAKNGLIDIVVSDAEKQIYDNKDSDYVKMDIVNGALRLLKEEDFNYVMGVEGNLNNKEETFNFIKELMNEECSSVIEDLYDFIKSTIVYPNTFVSNYISNELFPMYVVDPRYNEIYYQSLIAILNTEEGINDFNKFLESRMAISLLYPAIVNSLGLMTLRYFK